MMIMNELIHLKKKLNKNKKKTGSEKFILFKYLTNETIDNSTKKI